MGFRSQPAGYPAMSLKVNVAKTIMTSQNTPRKVFSERSSKNLPEPPPARTYFRVLCALCVNPVLFLRYANLKVGVPRHSQTLPSASRRSRKGLRADRGVVKNHLPRDNTHGHCGVLKKQNSYRETSWASEVSPLVTPR